MLHAPALRLRFRSMRASDLTAVAGLENAMLHPWPPALLAEALAQQRGWQMVGETEGQICCYASGTLVVDEAEIHRLVVAPDLRRRGIGKALLAACLHRLTTQGARYCFIEVRAGNASALALYRRCGFRAVGRRRNYYREPTDDALLLAIDLPALPPPLCPVDLGPMDNGVQEEDDETQGGLSCPQPG